ncbi:hypothetical protein OG500_01505 [Kitasatospora sp. NBC_01250]|uniref:hypothetical protein n=1 Tax=unclassified Kitasatospora TaxID=2633591 RepID=UPI002E127E5C|nr:MULTISPECIES: hypothetical protein [unclassified Kitasatospora]WSJ64865.1 hypothetical protein OG294_01440 [Kitasatospora sp. NBC_01302]
MQTSSRIRTGGSRRSTLRGRTVAVAAGIALLLTAGPALAEAKPKADSRTIDLACRGTAKAKVMDKVTDDPQLIHWTVDGVLTNCNTGDDQEAPTGDGAVHEVGHEMASCTAADFHSARWAQDIIWSTGEKSHIEGAFAFDNHDGDEVLTRAVGKVLSGPYQGDSLEETSIVMTTHPKPCEEAGLTSNDVVGTFEFWH